MRGKTLCCGTGDLMKTWLLVGLLALSLSWAGCSDSNDPEFFGDQDNAADNDQQSEKEVEFESDGDVLPDGDEESPSDGDSEGETEEEIEEETEEGDSDEAGESNTDGDVESDGEADTNETEEEAEDFSFCLDPIVFPKTASLLIGDMHTQIDGFFDSAFAFDFDGNMVAVDREGNLVKTTSVGVQSIWIAKAVKTARGLAYLSTGELVVADSGRGILLLAYPGGELRVLVPHMDAPSGVVVDKDDTVYVSEMTRSAIRRVNPRTGETVIIAEGFRFPPSGLAFSPDRNSLYIAGHGNGVIYAIDRQDGGKWSPIRKLAVIPGLEGPCEGKVVGNPCETPQPDHPYSISVDGDTEYEADFDFNDNDNAPVTTGTCQDDGGGDLYCRPTSPCDGKMEGDPCLINGYEAGFCHDDGTGYLECRYPEPCEGKNEGDPCQSNYGSRDSAIPADGDWMDQDSNPWMEGICKDNGSGKLVCEVVQPCEGKVIGDDCTTYGQPGKCQDGGDGALFCQALGPCDGKAEGDPCQQDWWWGSCQDDGSGALVCVKPDSCDGKAEGDACELEVDWRRNGMAFEPIPADEDYDYDVQDWDSPTVWGVCRDDGSGKLSCVKPNSCEGKNLGDPCEVNYYPGLEAPPSDEDWDQQDSEYLSSGTCQDDGTGNLYCRERGPCDDLQLGDECSYWGMRGVCMDDGAGGLYCEPVGPCYGETAGDECVTFDMLPGICEDDGMGELYCREVNPCEGKTLGDECEMSGVIGTCQGEESDLYCDIPQPCDGKVEGEACVTWENTDGICLFDTYSATLYCTEAPVCYGSKEGDACEEWEVQGLCSDGLMGLLVCQTGGFCGGLAEGDPCSDYSGQSGTCAKGANDSLYCKFDNPCTEATLGQPCETSMTYSGECKIMQSTGLPYCGPVYPCEGKTEGDLCMTSWGTPGVCRSDAGGPLYCYEFINPCADASLGDACKDEKDENGTCQDDGVGGLVCLKNGPCDGKTDGEACTDFLGTPGVCRNNGLGGLSCRWYPACKDKQEGDDCIHLRTRLPGRCVAGAEGKLLCQPTPPCEGKLENDACTSRSGKSGQCAVSDIDGVLFCKDSTATGALHGIATDACGNIYVSDDASDALWRFSPDGSSPAVVARANQSPVSHMAWGQPKGGWDDLSLYLSVQGGAEIMAIPLGLPGRNLVRPLTGEVLPETSLSEPETLCMNLSKAPISTEELVGPTGYHDVAFDSEGYMIGWDGFGLIRVNRDNQVEAVAPGLGGVQGMDWLPDGSLAVAADDGIVVIAPSGAKDLLAAGITAYGLTVGPDGLIYAADNNQLYRINPSTREVRVYLNTEKMPVRFSPRTVDFDKDRSLMYIGSMGESVYVLSLDKNYNPVGFPRWFAKIRSNVSYLDGLGVDECGNLYVPNYESSSLYRSTPDGRVSLYYKQEFDQYGHGLEWGNGVGGWRSDALYLPQPYDSNSVIEIVVGAGKNVLK